jgi:uncharacterized membrane protein YhhN
VDKNLIKVKSHRAVGEANREGESLEAGIFVQLAYLGLMLSVIGALVYVSVFQLAKPSLHRTAVKGCAVGGLILFALGFGAPFMLIVGLLWMFVTDIVVASGSFRTKRLLIIGMVTSIAGQGSFMLLFAQHWGGIENWLFGLVALLGFTLGVLTMLWGEMKKMLFPVMVYTVSVSALAYFSFGLMEPYRLAVYGSILFTIHAVVHAFEQFHLSADSRYVRITAPVVYMLYFGALAIFALAFILPQAV